VRNLSTVKTIGNARQAARALLSEETDTAALDADLLLSLALSVNRNLLEVLDTTELGPCQAADFEHLLQRRLAGEPIAYITQSKAFWTIDLQVSPATLVPRPETELVVERALIHCRSIESPEMADLGTGSGCIALAIASEVSAAHLVATDISADALEVAKQNCKALKLGNVSFSCGSWTEALPNHRFDIIVSNPPYIASDDQCLADKFMRFEPPVALIGGPDGLESIRRIVTGVRKYLKPGGWLIVEHGCDQGEAVRNLFESNGFKACSTFKDLANLDRVTEGRNG